MTEEVPVGSWVDDILDFWLREIGPEGWWVKSAATDDAITRRFGALWQEKKALPAESFLDSREKAFAAILLFDQFSRNMFRGMRALFETDPLACAIARGALERGYDRETEEAARSFFYIPFMHSEDLDDQHLCVELFEQPGFEYNLKFAREHRDIIARFGRFPHRNSVLGRSNRPGEEEAIAAGAGW